MTNAATESATKPGLGDLAEIFYAPSAVFARRTDGKFGVPYLALVVLGFALYFATRNLIEPIIDAAIEQGFATAAAKQPDKAAQIQQSMPMVKSITHGVFLLYYMIVPFIAGALLWVVGKLAKVAEIGKVAMLVATFSLYPKLLGTIVAAVLAAMQPDGTATAASISFSPARFVDMTASPALAGFLARFDLFMLWGILLMAIGLQAAGKATKAQAWTTAIGVWLIFALPSIWGLLKA